MRFQHAWATAAVAFSMIAVHSASATVTYDYVGPQFTQGEPSLIGKNITGSITFGGPVTATYTGYVTDPSDVTSYDLSSGTIYTTINADQINTYISYVHLYFSNGNLTGSIVAYKPGFEEFYISAPTPDGESLGLVYDYLYSTYGDADNLYTKDGKNLSATNSPGTFTEVSAVPLPAAFPLFGAALAGLTGLGIRKSRRTAA